MTVIPGDQFGDEEITLAITCLALTVAAGGKIVADHVRPRIESAYKEGKMVPLLPGPSRPQ